MSTTKYIVNNVSGQTIPQINLTSPLNFPEGSQIESIPESSGDGSGLTTLILKPDASTDDNRYVVLDPTGPNHIHIRAGGTIDQSNADLIIGGENNNLLISDSLNKVQIKTTDAEVEFIGYIDNGYGDGPGATLHVTDMINGTITDGMTIYGPGILGGYTLQFGTVLTPQGDGGVGNYFLPGGDFLTTSSTYIGGAITASNWTFGADGSLEFPDGSIQTTAIPDLISSGPSAPGSAVVANPTNVNINFSDGVGTAWSFSTTGLTFPDDTVQSTAYGPKYKVYTALLRQSGITDPVVTVLENTIGDIVWTRNNVGYYLGTLSNAFPENKTFIIYTHDGLNGNTGFPGGVRISNNEVQLVFNDGIVNVGDYIDIGQDAIESIEIRVYN